MPIDSNSSIHGLRSHVFSLTLTLTLTFSVSILHRRIFSGMLAADPTSTSRQKKAMRIKCRLVFMGIDNIHGMRKSWTRMSVLCQSSPSDDNDWLPALHNTLWLEHCSSILEGACQMAQLLEEEQASVLVHCSDGWDRTPQLTGLTMLMLDPYYRTQIGFEVLIEKEWISFGNFHL